ncbi:hypothetical protein Tco_0693718, partial [Tanacetum coccineum]
MIWILLTNQQIKDDYFVIINGVLAMRLVASNLPSLKGWTLEDGRRRCTSCFSEWCMLLNVESSKELWDSLEAKYIDKDASSKKFLVSYIIDKLPPSWIDFKHILKHLKEELTLVGLDSHLRIEESLIMHDSDKLKGNNIVCPSVWSIMLNIVNDNIGSAFMSTSKLNDSIKWHARLGHVYYKRMQDMSKDRTKSRVLGVWGCRAVVRLPDPKLKTLGERGIECIFVGYAEHYKAFRFYVIGPNESVLINSITESRNAIFDENRFSSVPRL